MRELQVRELAMSAGYVEIPTVHNDNLQIVTKKDIKRQRQLWQTSVSPCFTVLLRRTYCGGHGG